MENTDRTSGIYLIQAWSGKLFCCSEEEEIYFCVFVWIDANDVIFDGKQTTSFIRLYAQTQHGMKTIEGMST